MSNNMKKPPKYAKEKIDKDTIKKLLSYLFRDKGKLIFVIFCILISSVAIVSTSLFLEALIDSYITPLLGQSSPVFTGLLQFVGLMATVYIIGVIAAFLYSRIMAVIAQRTLKNIRDDMFIHMQKLPIRYFDTNATGDIMSYYTNDADTLRQFISQSLPQTFSALITIISVLISMFVTSWQLLIVMIIGTVINLYIGKTVGGKSSKFFIKQQVAIGAINGYIEEMITGQRVIKVFCHEEQSKEGFNVKNEELRKSATSANKFANILMPIMQNLGTLLYVILAVIGGLLAIYTSAGLTIGSIVAFLNLTRSFTNSVTQVAQQMNSIIMAFAGAKRIFGLLEEEVEQDAGYVTLVNAKYEGDNLIETEEKTKIWAWKHKHKDGTLTYKKLDGKVCLEEVDFGYTEEKLVLKNITISAKPGQKIAFVGATGAGKTTITNLINRFYDIASGKIRYDDINIEKIKKEDLRKSLGVVLQDTHLFTGTVMENIRYGNLDATDEECIAAAKKANADWFIELLPKSYDTVLEGDGSGLSQGQRQLLAIARAIVADPPVMILDEATSSIDTHTEAVVQRGMDKLMEGRTVFVIAHRLSTIQNSDLIIVLDHGQIIEQGNHDELISKKGKYYQLYTGAFEEE